MSELDELVARPGVRATVDDPQQFLADLAGVGHIDVLWKRNDRLPARPPHRVSVIDHDSNLSMGQQLRDL